MKTIDPIQVVFSREEWEEIVDRIRDDSMLACEISGEDPANDRMSVYADQIERQIGVKDRIVSVVFACDGCHDRPDCGEEVTVVCPASETKPLLRARRVMGTRGWMVTEYQQWCPSCRQYRNMVLS